MKHIKKKKEAVAEILKENMEPAADLLGSLGMWMCMMGRHSWFRGRNKKEGKRNEGKRFDSAATGSG